MKTDELLGLLIEVSPAMESTLNGFEQRSGFQLPADYRKFLSRSNGGQFSNALELRWPSPGYVGGEATTYVNRLFAIDAAPDWTAVRNMQQVLSDIEHPMFGVPDDLFSFGDDGCGNFLTIRLNAAHSGEIGFMDHETMGDAFTDPETYETVAPSFEHLLSMLRAE
ncbi:SMI1/KNR4 family protein [Allopontixanthobacter sp.]|uniref:SMI1/KNR4 family protein n=1 Tax=Allopontixanthobacter sp. TaxID=2906452 RepID=UPI002AB90B9E|nr:SMI1/KNR4 family protein [Allopontixanthobacter sp.]MDZ4306388.1 SMI1/KNR4 family protein [Allopontixanthobacter sp.]